jgi:hypothetical protein
MVSFPVRDRVSECGYVSVSVSDIVAFACVRVSVRDFCCVVLMDSDSDFDRWFCVSVSVVLLVAV